MGVIGRNDPLTVQALTFYKSLPFHPTKFPGSMSKVFVDACLGEGRRSQWVFLNADALTVKRQW